MAERSNAPALRAGIRKDARVRISFPALFSQAFHFSNNPFSAFLNAFNTGVYLKILCQFIICFSLLQDMLYFIESVLVCQCRPVFVSVNSFKNLFLAGFQQAHCSVLFQKPDIFFLYDNSSAAGYYLVILPAGLL